MIIKYKNAVTLSVCKNGCVRLFKFIVFYFKLEYGFIARRESV